MGPGLAMPLGSRGSGDGASSSDEDALSISPVQLLVLGVLENYI